MSLIFITCGVIVILLIGPILILLEKPRHWLMKHRGVTELSNRQRRTMAKRYKETTGHQFLVSKKRKRKTRKI